MPTCPTHSVEAVRRQGVSAKTGKPYDFLSCPRKNPDGSFCQWKPDKTAGTPAERPSFDSAIVLGRLEAKIDTLIRLVGKKDEPAGVFDNQQPF